MTNIINLAKTAQVSLEKKGLFNEKLNVVLALDISGSMSNLFSNGTVQQTVERLLGLGMNLDSNKSIEVYLFGQNNHYAGEVKEGNIEGYVQEHITKKFRLEGNTNYAGVMKRIGKDFVGYEEGSASTPKASGGLLGGLFKKKEVTPVVTAEGQRGESGQGTVVFFITDGNNSDKSETRKVITELSKHGIFWQFVGIGSASFSFLEELDDLGGRYIDNANFFKIRDIKKENDSDLYDKLLTELPSWVNEARSKNLIQ